MINQDDLKHGDQEWLSKNLEKALLELENKFSHVKFQELFYYFNQLVDGKVKEYYRLKIKLLQ